MEKDVIAEHAILIGPWGWIGWVLFIAMSALYAHLWNGSSAKKLRALQREVDAARKIISDLRKHEMELEVRNAELNTEITQTRQDMALLKEEMARVRKANEHLGVTVERQGSLVGELTSRLGEAEKLIIKLYAAIGRDIDEAMK
jgi:predicted  nucleic acid-binding Zn-ribbon protein